MLDVAKPAQAIPFDTKHLDRLMDEAGIDVLIANSKHNIQYLLGGHRSIFFDYMDAMGISRYLPLLVYFKGAPEKAAYFGHRLEAHQKEVAPFWTPVSNTNSGGSLDAMAKAVDHVRKAGAKAQRVGVEMAFLPADAAAALKKGLADSEIKDGLFVLERLRAVKRPDELALLRKASELVVDSMKATMAKAHPGMSKRELFETLRREEVNRGLTFEYLLLTAGSSLNRAPSDYKLARGDIMSLELGRQLPRLYRRRVPHGDPRRAGRGARGHAGRDRDDPARRHEADQGRCAGLGDLRGGRSALRQVQARRAHALPGARHGACQPRGAAADDAHGL